jgi:hypothetical protein
MSVEVDEITEKALLLSSNARAHLAEVLLESLDYEEDFAISPEGLAEIRLRCEEIDRGEVELLSGDEALAGLKLKYS